MAHPATPSLKPRKQPRQSRSAETVAVMLEAAAQVLETGGFEGFNTNAVARRAGVSVGSLYQYFPGKDALMLALMQRESELFRAEAAGTVDEPTGRQALERLITVCVKQQLQRPVLARLLDVEESRPAFQAEAAGLSPFEAMLEQIVRRPDMPQQTRPAIAAADLAALIRGMVDAAGQRGETDLKDLAQRLRAAAFGYLAGMDEGG